MTGRITFTIGDIHGMADHLDAVLKGIFEYIEKLNIKDWLILFHGDYIDRGPDSKRVVDTVISLDKNYPGSIITLRGNHEQMLLDASTDNYTSDVETFLMNGGKATLDSFGVGKAIDLPKHYIEFFKGTIFNWEDNLRYYVHAGVSPSVSLADQNNWDKLWIRREFLDYPGMFEKYIVHGHTPRMYDQDGGETCGNRINLDFGAVFGGKLVCAVFNNEQAKAINYIVAGASNGISLSGS